MVRVCLLALFLSTWLHAEEPFGKDSALLTRKSASVQQRLIDPFQQAISLHQTIISPSDGPRSHFYPSSSEYGKQAIRRFGIGKGLLLTFDRLLRENGEVGSYPIVTLRSKARLKWNPVPSSS